MTDDDMARLLRSFDELGRQMDHTRAELTAARVTVEKWGTSIDAGMNALREHFDAGFGEAQGSIGALNAKMDLDRAATGAGFQSVLEAIRNLEPKP